MLSNSAIQKLWGSFHGLFFAWEKGFKKLAVECDSSQAVQLLNDGQVASDNLALVRKYSRSVRTWLGYLHCPSPLECESSGWQNRGLTWVSSCKFLFPLWLTMHVHLRKFTSNSNLVIRVTISADKFGQPKGFAYVEFFEVDAVQSALLLDVSELHGHQLKQAGCCITCITSGLQTVKPGTTKLQDAGKAGLVMTIQGKNSAVLGTALICQAEKLLQMSLARLHQLVPLGRLLKHQQEHDQGLDSRVEVSDNTFQPLV
ncbi:hypothetical protein J1N35_033400 [Gossypium stocksii]|uniref:RRM domain-containing protein n=1 Tax=Gossypium stocksii TaxID=47602 RepID=A0A9D3UQ33_9ROSI|nr:hypothetical protein J1N35_033400 [Gossypium stocksii]